MASFFDKFKKKAEDVAQGVYRQANPFDGGKTYSNPQGNQAVPQQVQQSVQNAKYGVLANNPQRQNVFLNEIRANNFSPFKAGTATLGQNATKVGTIGQSLVSPIVNPVVKPLAATYDLSKAGVGQITGNKVARNNALRQVGADYNAAAQVGRDWVTRPVAQIGASVVDPTLRNNKSYTPGSRVEKAIFGDRPVQSVQVGARDTYRNHPNDPTWKRLGMAGGYAGLQVANDLPLASSAIKGVSKGAKAVASATKEVPLTNEALQARNALLQKRAVAEIRKPSVVPMIDKQIKAIDDTTKPRINLPFKPINNQIGAIGRDVRPEGAPKNLDEVFNDPNNIGLFEPAQKQANAFQDTLPSKSRPNSVKAVVNGGGTPLYHDTDAKGVMGILDSGTINPNQAPFSQIAGQGKRVSTTRNFDNYSRYHDSPYRLVIDESKTGQKSIPDNREEFESIFNKPVSTKAVQGVAVDITNPALIKDIQNGTFAKVVEKAKQKGITIEPFEGKILPNDAANAEIQKLTKELYAKSGAPIEKTPRVVVSEAVNKGSGTKVQRGIKVENGKPVRFEETVANKKLEIVANKELPNVSEKPVELKSIDGRENAPVKKQFIDLTNEYLGSQKAGSMNAVDRAKKFNEQFGNLTEKQKNEVIFATDDPKFGTKDPAVQRAVDYLRGEYDSAYRMFTEDKGVKLGYQESYYPRQYVNKKTGEEISAAEYNLLQKSSGRQRGRTGAELQEWKLVTRDPAEAMVKYYSSLEKAAAGQKYLKGLQDNGLVISSSEPVRGMQPVIAEGMQEGGMIYYAKPDVAKQLNKLFGSEKASGFFEKSLEKAQGFNSFMQSFVLSGGVPNTPINAFGVMQLMKSGMALHPIQGGKAFYMGMTRKGADKFFENHQSYLQDMAKNGLNVRYDYRPQMKSAKADIAAAFKDKGAAKAIATGWDELTNDATFGRFMPALETLHYKGVYDKLIKSMPADEAAKRAAKATANFFGKNTMAKEAVRSKVANDASGAFLFAPRFRESMLNFWAKNAQALDPRGGFKNARSVEYRDNMKFMAAAALTYAAMDGVNYSANGVHMYQNPDGKKDKMLIPGKDGQYVGIPFLPSIATVPRNAAMGLFNLATLKPDEALKNAKSFASIPVSNALDLITNENHFGGRIVDQGGTAAERAAQTASYLVKGNMQPWIREGMNAAGQKLPDEAKKLLGIKKQSGIQTASQALELPFRFYDSQNFKGGSDNFKTADGSTLGKTRAANKDNRDEIIKAAMGTPEAKRFFANTDAKQQELADNDPELQKLYDQRKAMLTGLKKDKVASVGQGMTEQDKSNINSWNRLTTTAKTKLATTNPERKKAYDLSNAKLQLAMGEIDKAAYDKKVASLTKTKAVKKASTGRKAGGGRKGRLVLKDAPKSARVSTYVKVAPVKKATFKKSSRFAKKPVKTA